MSTRTGRNEEFVALIAQAVTSAVVAALAEVDLGQPAVATPAQRTRKPATAAPKALTAKQRKAWNTKFGALMRACPQGSYRAAMDRWTEVQSLRDSGKTPAQARKALGFSAR